MESTTEFSLIPVLLPAALVIFFISIGVIFLNLHFRKNLLKQKLEKEVLKANHHFELLKANIASQEVERKRIAMDIHDEIGALLTTSRMYLYELKPGQTEEELEIASDKIDSLFIEIAANIRRISYDLRPVILENLGLVSAIESMFEKLEKAGIHLQFIHHFSVEMSKEAELSLYRIIQELIANTVKHARARNIHLKMSEDFSSFYVDYQDDGVGFLFDQVKTGLGTRSIQTRLSLLHGEIEVLEPPIGVHYLIRIDINQLIDNERH